MATTNEILAEIAAFTAANGRPCPAKHLTDKFGADAADLIKSLKSEGKIYGRRGRTGGLVSNEGTPSVDVSAPDAVADAPADDLAAEFAALAAKIAAESDAGEVAATGT
jgi:hypothetical protein